MALRGLWGSLFSREGGRAFFKLPQRGLFSKVEAGGGSGSAGSSRNAGGIAGRGAEAARRLEVTLPARLLHHPLMAQMNGGELCMGIRQIQLDLTAGLGGPACDFGYAELEPIEADRSALGAPHPSPDCGSARAEDSTTPGTTR